MRGIFAGCCSAWHRTAWRSSSASPAQRRQVHAQPAGTRGQNLPTDGWALGHTHASVFQTAANNRAASRPHLAHTPRASPGALRLPPRRRRRGASRDGRRHARFARTSQQRYAGLKLRAARHARHTPSPRAGESLSRYMHLLRAHGPGPASSLFVLSSPPRSSETGTTSFSLQIRLCYSVFTAGHTRDTPIRINSGFWVVLFGCPFAEWHHPIAEMRQQLFCVAAGKVRRGSRGGRAGVHTARQVLLRTRGARAAVARGPAPPRQTLLGSLVPSSALFGPQPGGLGPGRGTRTWRAALCRTETRGRWRRRGPDGGAGPLSCKQQRAVASAGACTPHMRAARRTASRTSRVSSRVFGVQMSAGGEQQTCSDGTPSVSTTQRKQGKVEGCTLFVHHAPSGAPQML